MIRIEINKQDLRRFNLDMRKRKEINKVLTRIMDEVTAEAKAHCPVRTGQLRNSWRNCSTEENLIINGYQADYASYVEFGTDRMRPRLFLSKSVEAVKRRIPEIIQSELNL